MKKIGLAVGIILSFFLVISIVNLLVQGGYKQSAVQTPENTNVVSSEPPDEGAPSEPTDVSSVPRPSDEQIIEYESALNTQDAEQRNTLLSELVTPQYLEAFRDDSVNLYDFSLTLNRDETKVTEVTVTMQSVACYVVTEVVLDKVQDGVTEQIEIGSHASFWINTPEGWRVAREVRSY